MVAIVTIDGPSGTGKGTLSRRLAQRLGWGYLDSGAVYRALGLAVERAGIAFDDELAVTALALRLPLQFESQQDDDVRVLLAGDDVSRDIRTEQSAARASEIAQLPRVRDALLAWQRRFAVAPGLVADGRDMGTVVFPQAAVKVFLTASAPERARRRYRQLLAKGVNASIPLLTVAIETRDRRDQARTTSPLIPAGDALTLDSTALSAEQVFDQVMHYVRTRLPALSAPGV